MREVGAPVSQSAIDVPGYDVGERIGSGGFGEVYRARHAVIGREVAIKVLHAKYSADPASVARFVAEARAVNKISHPNIVEISDFGELSDGRQYCVMELIRGTTLRDVLRDRERLPLADALPILRGIAEAVDAAHDAGIAHRDLKPENVFVLDGGGVKLIDFGLAKLMDDDASVTQTGAVFGTPLYMSPEQCRGRAVSLATDAYSFGALAYHVLVGTPPFQGEPLDLAVQHINDSPEPPSSRFAELPRRVDHVLLALLAKEPETRPARLLAAVDALAGTTRLRRRVLGRNALAASAFAICGALLVGGFVISREHAPVRESAWSTRTLRLDLDGTTVNPIVTRDGAHMLYADASGWWQHDFASGKTQRLDLPVDHAATVDSMPDGTLLVGATAPRLTTELVDLRTGAHQHVVDAAFPSASPDGQYVAGWDADNWLVVYELATGATRRLHRVTEGILASAPRWSPDGRVLVWGRSGMIGTGPAAPARAFVTRVSDGETVPVPALALRAATTNDYFDSVAFLADGRIAYCSSSPVEIRARPVFGGAETTLAVLDPQVSECMFARRGRGLVVTLGYSQTTIGVLSLERVAGHPAVLRQVAGPTHLEAVAATSDRIYAVTLESRFEDDLRTVSYDKGTITPVRGCPEEAGLARRGDEVFDVSVDRASHQFLRLRALGTCEVVAEWSFPPGIRRFGAVQCVAAWCAVTGTMDDHTVLWKLEPGRTPISLAELPPDTGQLAIAPDARTLALRLKRDVYFVPAAGGAARKVSFEDATGLDGIAWGIDERLLVSGQEIDGAAFALDYVSPDGVREAVWSSKATYMRNLFTDPAGKRLVADIATWRQEFLLLDPAD